MKTNTAEQTAGSLVALLAGSAIRGRSVRASERWVDAVRDGACVRILYSVEVACTDERVGTIVVRRIYAADIATSDAAAIVADMARELKAAAAVTRNAIRRERAHS